LARKTVETKLELEEKSNKHAHAQELKAVELKRQIEETRLDLEDKADEKAHAQELRAIRRQGKKVAMEGKKQRQKDEADHLKQLREAEKQWVMDEVGNANHTRPLAAQKQIDSDSAEKQRKKDEKDHPKRIPAKVERIKNEAAVEKERTAIIENQATKDAGEDKQGENARASIAKEKDNAERVKAAEKDRKTAEAAALKERRAIETQAKKDADKEKQRLRNELHAITKQQEKAAASIANGKLKEEAAHVKAKRAQQRQVQKDKNTLDKLYRKKQLDETTHQMLSREFEQQMQAHELEYDLARAAMQDAIARGRKCTMSENPPCIDFTTAKITRGWVTWEIE